MKKEIKYLTATSLFVFLLLMVSGSFKGILQTIIYILAFFVPLSVCLYLYFGKENTVDFNLLKLDREGGILTLLLLSPSVLLILLCSLGTSAAFAIFGFADGTVIEEPPLLALLLHALLPALLEEGVFRYLPMRLMGKRAPRAAVFISSALFALLHHSFFSIPYAFVAGLIFMTADLAVGSVIPSFIIHFINNTVALIAMGALWIEPDIFLIIIILSAAALVSLALLLLWRKRFLPKLCGAFSKGEGCSSPFELIYLALPSFVIAFFEIWSPNL